MAGFISPETIDAIHNTVDIVSVIGDYTTLKSRGANDYWGCCPFHGEKTPSFHVDSEKKFYHCFG
jgi:DNA primase